MGIRRECECGGLLSCAVVRRCECGSDGGDDVRGLRSIGLGCGDCDE